MISLSAISPQQGEFHLGLIVCMNSIRRPGQRHPGPWAFCSGCFIFGVDCIFIVSFYSFLFLVAVSILPWISLLGMSLSFPHAQLVTLQHTNPTIWSRHEISHESSTVDTETFSTSALVVTCITAAGRLPCFLSHLLPMPCGGCIQPL